MIILSVNWIDFSSYSSYCLHVCLLQAISLTDLYDCDMKCDSKEFSVSIQSKVGNN